MTFRRRLFLAFGLAALIPLGVLAVGVRRELTRRLVGEDIRRTAAATGALRDELDRTSGELGERVAALARDLAVDNRLRLGIAGDDSAARRAVLDLAGEAMRTSGLALLQLQDAEGRIVSSGQFRNEFDRLEPALPRALAAAGGAPVLVRARTPESTLVVLTRMDSLRVAGRSLTLVGGVPVEPRLTAALARDPELGLRLVYADSVPSARTGDSLITVLGLPFVDLTAPTPGGADTARVIVTRSPGTLRALRRKVDHWSLAALGITLALALATAAGLAARISRPLTELAGRTAAIDLERLDPPVERSNNGGDDDEIAALARGLDAMTERLRQGTARLRDAERRIATGDLARQVNHDVKNGLVPIRNVVRHLAQVARDEPAALARVFEERRGTLESSLDYLDTLARNYARLSPELRRERCDVNAIAAEVVRAVAAPADALRSELAPGLPAVAADPLVLRRILENLVSNAIESLAGRDGGRVTLVSERTTSSGRAPIVRLTVADTGPGMSRAELERAVGDFHTTKTGGAGLGLSIVRRLVADLGGTFRIETAPGAGTRAIVELPIEDVT